MLEKIRKDLEEYLELEDRLYLEGRTVNVVEDPNISSELDVLKQEKITLLKKIISQIEDGGLVNDMPKDIASVYFQIKKST